MPININNIWVFRIIPIQNLDNNLFEGMYCKNAGKKTKDFVTLGSRDVISRRDTTIVKCYPDTVVNDYVPFYFSIRTPMLYNIITGHGVNSFPQEDIIYLCFKLTDLTTNNFKWCYTNGNAASSITKFFNSLDNIDTKIDWHSVYTTDFRDDNEDGDEDRVRKKHAEFLIKDFVPAKFIKAIVVYNESKAKLVKGIINKLELDIEVLINQKNKYYFI